MPDADVEPGAVQGRGRLLGRRLEEELLVLREGPAAHRPFGLEGPEGDRAHDERDQRLGADRLDARTLRPCV